MKKGYLIFASFVFFISCNSSTDTKSTDTKASDTAAAPAPAEAKDPEAAKGLGLIAKSDCLTCHKLNEASIGPAYAAVAAKYQGQSNMIDSLAHKVIKGGSGVWGTAPMTPHPLLSEEDAKAMVHYVLSVK